MNKSPSRLVILTPFYPYIVKKISYDYYIGNEIRVLSRKFNKILLISTNPSDSTLPDLPPNVEVKSIGKPGKISFFSKIKTLFSIYFWKELYSVFSKEKKLNLPVIKSCFLYFSGIFFYKKRIHAIVDNNEYSEPGTVYYSYWSLDYGTAMAFIARKKKIPFVSRVHSLDIYYERYASGYLPARILNYQLGRIIFSVSDQAKNYYHRVLDRHNISHGKIITSRLAVGGPGTFRTKPTSPKDGLVLVSNSWLQPIKRLDKLIEALSLIKDIPVTWYHIGDDYGTGYIKDIKALVQKHLAPCTNIQVHFTGALTHHEIFNFYTQHPIDLIVNTSDFEGIPVSIMEAFAFSIPAIATNVGGVSEIVTDTYNGFLLDKNNGAVELSARLEKYVAMNLPEIDQLRKNAFDTWNEKYNDEKNYTLLSSYLEKLMPE